VGHGPKGFTWTVDRHKKYRQTNRDQMHDVVIEQVAEGNTVASTLRVRPEAGYSGRIHARGQTGKDSATGGM
jgi:hypothetical protein